MSKALPAAATPPEPRAFEVWTEHLDIEDAAEVIAHTHHGAIAMAAASFVDDGDPDVLDPSSAPQTERFFSRLAGTSGPTFCADVTTSLNRIEIAW